MKKVTLIVFLLTFSFLLVSSQKTEDESEFLSQILVGEKDSVIYVEESSGWEKMKEKLNRKKFKDYQLNNSNIIELSDSEYNYILREIAKNENFIWNSNLFSNSEKVSQKNIEAYLIQKNKPFELEFESNKKLNDTSAVVEMKNREYFALSFSKPIFFRKNKFCLFSLSYVTTKKIGNYSKVAFYKKENGNWIEWLELYNSLN